MEREPQGSLAAEVLPPPLYRALTHLFSQGMEGAMLVGGTALAGYYAGHRRSEDLDLFTRDGVAQKAAVLCVRSLTEIGASLGDERSSARMYGATCRLQGHDFTVQVVLDPHLFEVGTGIEAGDGVVVASLETLLRMKAATLVSRASEKDLYDLAWFFERDEGLDIPELIALGQEVDGGRNGESVLISLVGTRMRKSACGFSRSQEPGEVLTEVNRVRKGLIQGLERHLRSEPAPPIAALIRMLG